MQALAAWRLELTFDEAYYTLWSRSLSFGYLDHPPMVALIIRASTSLFGGSELGVRALSLLVVGAMPALIALIAWRLFGSAEKAALAALMWIAMPLVSIGAVFVTPDAPLVVFWTLGLAALVELWRTGQRRWLIALGLALGLALQSKFTAALFRRWRRARPGRDAVAPPLASLAGAVCRAWRSRWRSSPRSSSGTPCMAGRPSPSSLAALRRTDSRLTTRPNSLSLRSVSSIPSSSPRSFPRFAPSPGARRPAQARPAKPGAFSSARLPPRRSISFCIRFTTACRATGSRRSIPLWQFWSPTGSPRPARRVSQASPLRSPKRLNGRRRLALSLRRWPSPRP